MTTESISRSGAPVVVIHGIPGSAGTWSTLVADLAAGHRVVAENLVGFGPNATRPDLESLRAEAQAATLAEHLDRLGVSAAVVVGHDFGGPVALHLVDRRPDLVGGLVLLGTNTFPDTPIPLALKLVTIPAVGALLARAVFSRPSLYLMTRTMVGRPKRKLDAAIYVGSRNQARSIRLIFRDALANIEQRYAPFPRIMAQAHIPVTVMWGDRDPFFTVDHGRRTASAFRDAQFVLLHDAGHALPEERPEDIVAEVARIAGTLAVHRA